jgi:hypothetical protein
VTPEPLPKGRILSKECLNALTTACIDAAVVRNSIQMAWKKHKEWLKIPGSLPPDYFTVSPSLEGGTRAAQYAVWEAKKSGQTLKKLLLEVGETFPKKTPQEDKAFCLAWDKHCAQKARVTLARLEEQGQGDTLDALREKENLAFFEERIARMENSPSPLPPFGRPDPPRAPAAPVKEKRAMAKRLVPNQPLPSTAEMEARSEAAEAAWNAPGAAEERERQRQRDQEADQARRAERIRQQKEARAQFKAKLLRGEYDDPELLRGLTPEERLIAQRARKERGLS